MIERPQRRFLARRLCDRARRARSLDRFSSSSRRCQPRRSAGGTLSGRHGTGRQATPDAPQEGQQAQSLSESAGRNAEPRPAVGSQAAGEQLGRGGRGQGGRHRHTPGSSSITPPGAEMPCRRSSSPRICRRGASPSPTSGRSRSRSSGRACATSSAATGPRAGVWSTPSARSSPRPPAGRLTRQPTSAGSCRSRAAATSRCGCRRRRRREPLDLAPSRIARAGAAPGGAARPHRRPPAS